MRLRNRGFVGHGRVISCLPPGRFFAFNPWVWSVTAYAKDGTPLRSLEGKADVRPHAEGEYALAIAQLARKYPHAKVAIR